MSFATILTEMVTESFSDDTPVFLVKKYVDSRLLRSLRFLGADATHWALKVRGVYYQLDLSSKSKSNIRLSTTPIPRNQVIMVKQIAWTRMDHHHIMRLANQLIENQKRIGKYNLLNNSCQEFVEMLTDMIAPDPEHPVDFKGILMKTGIIEGEKWVGRTKRNKFTSAISPRH